MAEAPQHSLQSGQRCSQRFAHAFVALAAMPPEPTRQQQAQHPGLLRVEVELLSFGDAAFTLSNVTAARAIGVSVSGSVIASTPPRFKLDTAPADAAENSAATVSLPEPSPASASRMTARPVHPGTRLPPIAQQRCVQNNGGRFPRVAHLDVRRSGLRPIERPAGGIRRLRHDLIGRAERYQKFNAARKFSGLVGNS